MSRDLTRRTFVRWGAGVTAAAAAAGCTDLIPGGDPDPTEPTTTTGPTTTTEPGTTPTTGTAGSASIDGNILRDQVLFQDQLVTVGWRTPRGDAQLQLTMGDGVLNTARTGIRHLTLEDFDVGSAPEEISRHLGESVLREARQSILIITG